MRRPGLRFKLTILYTAIFSALLSGFFLFAYYLLANQLEATATDELLERATGLKGYLRFQNGAPTLVFDADDPDVPPVDTTLDEAKRILIDYVKLISNGSGVVQTTPASKATPQ